jgi:flavin reductase (DIM6/NTAB) family NADH-FMN oxidoreductase RutF
MTATEHDPTDARRLRDAFGAFATGVTVVTARGDDGGRVGLTANSLTSVSLDPPLLLFCPAQTASALPVLQASKRFAINVLAVDQRAIADRFGRKNVDRFAGAEWEDWDGLPVLSGALANFACTLFADHDGGDHRVVIGAVQRLRVNAVHDPLLYFRGAYRQVHVPT